MGYINGITVAASIVTSIGVIFTALFAAYRWYLKQNKQDEEIEKLKDEDIKKIKEEQCMHTYVLLAILDGLKQQGCNGAVTEAREKLSKHINKLAHDMED